MSIVYDYLKQIRDKKEPSAVPSAPNAPVASSEKSVPTKTIRWKRILWAVAIVVSFALVLFFIVGAPQAMKPVMKLYEGPLVEKTSVPVIRSTGDNYTLEGIIYNPAQPFAIINGKMLELKGKIGTLEVEKITPDSVTLRDTQDRSTRILRL